MYNKKPSVVIINGINALGLEISKRFDESSSVVVTGNLGRSDIDFPKHITVIDQDTFATLKLSKIKTIIVLYHEKIGDLVSATDLVNHAKFLSDVFSIATNNNAKIVITTSLSASKKYVYAKFVDKDRPYDFPSFQNFIEKLSLEQNRKTPTYILRVGDLYGKNLMPQGVVYRMLKDALTGNFIRVDEDGLEKLFPISTTEVSNLIKSCLTENTKGGIYTVSPTEGVTQITFANMCIEFAPHVSHLRFIKPLNKSYENDPMYENMYSPAPYLEGTPENSTIEQDLSLIISSMQMQPGPSLKEEEEPERIENKNDFVQKVKKFNYKALVISISVVFLLLVLAIVPLSLMIINTRLISDGNAIFFNNYDKSMIAELPEDSRFNKEKASALLSTLKLGFLILFAAGDDLKTNEDFLNAEVNYFDALSYSRDYKFLTVADASRTIVQIKLQDAKTLIDSLDKNKLFWDLQDRYDRMKQIIDDAKV